MKILQVILSVLMAQAAGLIGSVFTVTNIGSWYAALNKPSWNPPNWLFGPVWTLLYTLMGIAAYLVYQQRDLPGAKLALWVYGSQLALNALWSVLFFGLQNPQWAFFEIIVLLILIIVTTVLFWRINTWAGILMLPYIAWVTFASALNYKIWQLN